MNADQTAKRDPGRTLELLWGTAAPPSRGPKPALSVHQIVQKAVEIADADGLAAVSMRRVAEELGFTTMSLYRYVPSKEDLLELMQEESGSPVPDPDDAPAHWRDAVIWWAERNLDMFRRHPWWVDIPIQRPPMGPNSVRFMECLLRPLEKTGLSPGEMLGILQLVSTYTLSVGRIELSLTQAAEQTGVAPDDWDPLYGQMLDRVVNDDELPALASMIRAGVFSGPPDGTGDDPSDDIRFGLDLILDGIEALITRRREA